MKSSIKDKIDLSTLSDDELINLPQFKNNNGNVSWFKISRSEDIPEDFISRNLNKVDIRAISNRTNLSEEFILKHKNILNLKNVLSKSKVSQSFIELHLNEIDINVFLNATCVDEEFIEKHLDKIDLEFVLKKRMLSKEFVEKHLDRFVNIDLFKYMEFDNEYVINNYVNFNMMSFCKYASISEDILDKYLDVLDKDAISLYQCFSYEFYLANRLNLNKCNIINNPKLSLDLKKMIRNNEIKLFRKAVEDNFDDIKLHWTKWFTKIIIKNEINNDISRTNFMHTVFYEADYDRYQDSLNSDEIDCDYGICDIDFENCGEKYYCDLFDKFIENVSILRLLYKSYCCNYDSGIPNYIETECQNFVGYLHDYELKKSCLELFDPLQCFKENYKNINIKKFINNKNVSEDVKKEIQAFCSLL